MDNPDIYLHGKSLILVVDVNECLVDNSRVDDLNMVINSFDNSFDGEFQPIKTKST